MCFDVFWCILMYLDVFGCVLMCSDVCWGIWMCLMRLRCLMTIVFDVFLMCFWRVVWMCFDVFWCVLIDLDVFECVVMCFDVFWRVLMCFDVFWCALMCFDVFWCVLVCFDVFGTVKNWLTDLNSSTFTNNIVIRCRRQTTTIEKAITSIKISSSWGSRTEWTTTGIHD